MKVRNNFESWLQEASLKDNPAIPGESGEIGKKYLQSVDARAQQKLADLSRRLRADIPQFMGLVREVKSLQQPHKEALEDLAQKVILELYGSILEDTILDIKFPEEGEIQDMMTDVPADPEMPQLKKLEDLGIINKIQKRKIANNITQGEAKNAKKALNSETSIEGIIAIMGEQNGNRYIDLLNKISDMADFFDWSIPMDVQKDMWERDKSGFSGSVKVSWEKDEEDEEEEKDALDILKDLEENPEFDPEDVEDLFDEGKTKITARGLDYAMLLHESIKGIYELIAAASIPQDEETAQIVIMNTDTLADEIEDLRYGPYIAQDLRDFINTFPESDRIENLREFVFGHILDENNLSDEDFLKLMNDILLGMPILLNPNAVLDEEFADQIRAAASRAKLQMSRIVKEIAQMMGDYERSVAGMDMGEMPGRAADMEVDTESKEDIMAKIDIALDRGDFAEAKRLSDILNKL
jgi:hypothetical protein